jgi:hypothetical protein
VTLDWKIGGGVGVRTMTAADAACKLADKVLSSA